MARNPSLRKWLALLFLVAPALALSAGTLASPSPVSQASLVPALNARTLSRLTIGEEVPHLTVGEAMPQLIGATQGEACFWAEMAQDWVTIFCDDFEGDFPGPWRVADASLAPGQYHWGKRSCQAFEGSHSAWAVGGGDDGALLPCGSDYPDHRYSYMAYGPFSLQGASAAELSFQLWLNSEPQADSIFWGFSTDGEYYRNDDPPRTGDSGGWTAIALDLAAAIGEPEVWIAFIFSTDASIRYADGAHVDNVVLRKRPGAAQTPTATRPVQQQHKAHLPIALKLAGPMAPPGVVRPAP
jgi:hypothetical protein